MIRWIMAIIQSADLLPLYALHSQRSETQEKNSPKNPQIHMAPFVLSCPTWLMDSNLFAEWRVYWVTHFLFVLFGFTTSHFLMRLVSYYLVTFRPISSLISCLFFNFASSCHLASRPIRPCFKYVSLSPLALSLLILFHHLSLRCIESYLICLVLYFQLVSPSCLT